MTLTIFFVACNNIENRKEEIKPAQESSFQKFVKKFKSLELPYKYYNVFGKDAIYVMKKLDATSVDTLFVSSIKQQDDIYCAGYLSDTSRFYSFVFYYPYQFAPVISTYSKDGKMISEECLIGCGVGDDLAYCSITGIVNKDFTIFCADTMFFKGGVDESGKSLPPSDSITIDFKRGMINPNGTIIMEKEQRIAIKNNH
ncbi:MAG TPA: hypothetical protein VK835_04205 [Bacteroidia bacterium]|nr:hypothetical protein [Bacteroidia bacterium]